MTPKRLPILRRADGIDYPELRPQVKELQKALGLPSNKIDGKFGPGTEAAVKRFQISKGLAVDGIVGTQTWSALLGELVEVFSPRSPRRLPLLRRGDGIDILELADAVAALQKALGLPSNKIDGKFDPGTEAAVKRFQISRGLAVDGIVGAQTWSALLGELVEIVPRPTPPPPGPVPPDIEKIVNSVPANLREFARDSIPLILSEARGVTDRGQIAYILATAEHESLLGKFLEELSDGSQYEGREDLGNTQPGDGPRFKGRGFVQITGRNNYTDWAQRLGIDLVGNPEKAAEPATAAKILVQGMSQGTFTGAKLGDFINGDNRNFINARKIVNGQDKAEKIASIAERFLAVLT